MIALRRAWRAFAGSVRFQLATVKTNPDYFMSLATAPAFAVAFLSIVRHAGREDLTSFALLAPVFMTLWHMSIFVSGELIGQDRGWGTLEPLIATPAAYPVVLIGRTTAVSFLGVLSLIEVSIVGRLLFGVTLHIWHPAVFAATIAASVFAMAGTSLIFAAVFVLGRSTRIFQQSLNYPFYVLGGVIVPIATLPSWLHPVSKGVFLSWTTELLRDACNPAAIDSVVPRIAAVLALGALGGGVGVVLVGRVLRRVRNLGTVNFA
jgi:ABC-2 type transport system permease protein